MRERVARAERRGGFTLIEMLVASLLLGMLATILTMIFNSSAIAWRTGKASVSGRSLQRREMAYRQWQADNALPGGWVNGETGMQIGAWERDVQTGEADPGAGLATRAVEAPLDAAGVPDKSDKSKVNSGSRLIGVQWTGSTASSADGYAIGVWSWGPDGIKDTEDDITTWPDVLE